MADLAVKAVITADGMSLVGATDQGVQQLGKLQAAAKAVGDQSKASAGAHNDLRDSFKNTGSAAEDNARKLELSNTQTRALFTSSRAMIAQFAAGASPTQVLYSQVGRLAYAFRDGEQAAALIGAALGSVTTWAVAAGAAIVAVAAATIQYNNSARLLNNTIGVRGNPFAVTAADAEAAAQSIAKAADLSAKQGRQFEAAFSSTNINPKLFDQLAASVRGASAALGDDLDGTLKTLTQAIAEPAAGVDTLNSKFNLLTGPETQFVKDLDAQGKTAQASAFLLDKLTDRVARYGDKVGTVSLSLREFAKTGSNAWDAIGKAAGGVNDTTGPNSATGNALSRRLLEDANTVDSYGSQVRDLRNKIAEANSVLNDSTSSSENLAAAHRILSSATLTLREAEKSHADQLRALNPVEQARYQRMMSLITGSDEVTRQAAQEADATQRLAGAVTDGSLAYQKTNDQLEIERATLPYVIAQRGATIDQYRKLQATIDSLTQSMKEQQVAQHGIDAVNEVRSGLGGLSDHASVQAQDDALEENRTALGIWLKTQVEAAEAAGLATDKFYRETDEVYADKLDQLYRDDLQKRKDWASGTKQALVQLGDDQTDWASKSRELTVGASKEFENDFVDAILHHKDPLQAFFNWYLEQLLHIIFQQKIAASANSVLGGLTDGLGGLLGLGGGGGSVQGTGFSQGWSLSDIIVPTVHGGGNVGGAGNTRAVDPRLFLNAPRFHDGTLPLNVGERAAILKDDETVRTAAQERALGAAPRINFTLVNRSGTPVRASQGATSPDGQGGFNMEVFLDQIDQGLATRAKSGNSALFGTMEQITNMKRGTFG